MSSVIQSSTTAFTASARERIEIYLDRHNGAKDKDIVALCQVFEDVSEAEREALQEEAIELIARIQAATPKAFERDSIASRLAFDEAKLSWELNFFFEHYFGSYRKEKLTHGQTAELKA